MTRKTDQKRRGEYAALKNLVFRMRELADKLAEELSKEESLKDLTKEEISLLLRMPCIYCDVIRDCLPESKIISIFSCRILYISARHHSELMMKSQERLGKVSNSELAEFRHELLALRLPGRLKLVYNRLYMEQRMGFYEYFARLADPRYRERLTKPLRTTIRITRKAPENILERLERYGYELKQVPRYDRGYRVVSGDTERIGNLLEYALGYIYLQEAASMIPPVALQPERGDKILDLCAAPGSKTTQMADMIKNDGVIVANDVNPIRLRMLGSNVQRTSSYSVIVTRFDGRRLPKALREKFDKVLVDAPCSALGTARRFPENVERRNLEFTLKVSRLQYNLLKSAIYAAKPGARIVYSTCTLTVEENEMVVDRILKEFPELEVERFAVKGVKFSPGLTKRQGLELDDRLRHTARIYPRQNDTEGFYVAILRKRSAW